MLSTKNKMRGLIIAVVMTALLFSMAGAQDIQDNPVQLLEEADLQGAVVYDVQMVGDVVDVCLDVSTTPIGTGDLSGIEDLILNVRYALTPLTWRVLDVSVYDTEARHCVDIADWMPAQAAAFDPRPQLTPSDTISTQSAGQGALAGKTVYLSAGHGWYWSDYNQQWRTQRGVYEGFIEDHNNAEAVDQYLIEYLENAGATVIPVRERDWNTARIISDNDVPTSGFSTTGIWKTGSGLGYDDKTYLYIETTTGPASSTATWTLHATTQAEYAVYAWVRSGSNRAPDAHYRIQHAAGTSDVYLDQRIRPETWRYLGTYPVGTSGIVVTLDNHSSIGGAAVIADAVRIGGGAFNTTSGMTCLTDETPVPSYAPNKPWWETSAYYYSQLMGFPLSDCSYSVFNDVIARPIFSRWMHSGTGEDALYISWHTNGYRGITRGTESYVYEGSATYGRTEGSLELQAAVHDELIRDIRAGWDSTWTDRGKKQADLGELRMLWDVDPATRMPGVLLEIAFHDQPDDALALLNPRFNQLSARAIYQGIVKYFEGRDGIDFTLVPEPPTHLRAENIGDGKVRVSWHASPTDSVGLAGDAAVSYRVYTSLDGFAWREPVATSATSLELTYAQGQTVYFKVAGVNAGGESFATEVVGARMGNADLLIVSAFDKLNHYGHVIDVDPIMGANKRMFIEHMNAFDYVTDHGNVIPEAYGGWDSASNEAIMAGETPLNRYKAVDWILGEETTEVNGTLNSAERSLIQAYLNQGGGLLISGAELGWDLVEKASAATWLPQTLKTNYIADDAGTFTVQAVGGSIFDGLGIMTFDEPSAYMVDYPDVYAPVNGSTTAMTYVGGTGGSAAVVYDGMSKIVNFGFPIETLRPASRESVMQATLAFLLPGAGEWIDTQITSPGDGSAYATTPGFSGTAAGSKIPSQVQVSILRESDQRYWTSSLWGGETWLSATGTTSWSYTLPSLGDGTYTVRARAMTIDSLVDDSPAISRFTVDSVAPTAPLNLLPEHGVWVTSAFPVLSWDAIGEPVLRYDVELDGVIRTTTTNSFTHYVAPMIHVWRVRAIDAAGNVGSWSAYQAFMVDVELLYLPTILGK